MSNPLELEARSLREWLHNCVDNNPLTTPITF